MGIFKAYDIRGIYPDELNEEIAYKIGRAFVTFIGCKKVMVGIDMRNSSEKLFEALVRGINDQGADVVYIGLCSTPMFYFSARNMEAAIMVTASHNPGKYNGFKLLRKNIVSITGETGIKDIEKLVKKNKFGDDKKGKITKKDVMEEYIEHSLKFAKNLKKLRFVFDPGNGMGALTFPKVFERIDCDFIPMYAELDGNFPNHEADPVKPKNVKDLQKKVLEEKADFGVATDGDADRIFFIDEKGNWIRSELTAALISKRFLKDNPGSKILYTIVCSWLLRDAIKENGGEPVVIRIGHSFVKERMKKDDIIFGAELSGHFYYKDNFFAENSIITTLLIMNILSEENKTLSQLLEPLKKYHKTEEINFKIDDKEEKIKEIEKMFYDGKISHLDGLTVEFEDWWFNVRPSNTEPLLRLNVEAETKEKMEQMKYRLSKLISN